jgi:hypothetical protein
MTADENAVVANSKKSQQLASVRFLKNELRNDCFEEDQLPRKLLFLS